MINEYQLKRRGQDYRRASVAVARTAPALEGRRGLTMFEGGTLGAILGSAGLGAAAAAVSPMVGASAGRVVLTVCGAWLGGFSGAVIGAVSRAD
jgi:hypothetical protein